MSSPRASASVLAAGVVAILGSCFAILGAAFGLLGLALLPSTPSAQQFPPTVRSMAMVAIIMWLAIAVFEVITGIGILRLKYWARISAIVWAGVSGGLSWLCLFFAMIAPLPEPAGAAAVPMAAVRISWLFSI
jgi:uncharacterized membrane protein